MGSMERVTYCMVCGAGAHADLERCPDCGAPLHTEKNLPLPRVRRRKFPVFWLVVSFAVVALAVLIYVLLASDALDEARAPQEPASPAADPRPERNGTPRTVFVPAMYVDPLPDLGKETIPGNREALISGRVVFPEGEQRPLHVWVRARHGTRQRGGTRCEPDGTFELAVGAGGRADLTVEHAGRRATAWDVPAGTKDLRLVLADGASRQKLRIKVTGPDHLPIEGAHVRAVGHWRTDSNGIAELTGLPDWWLDVEVKPPLARTDLLAPPRRRVRPEGQEIRFRFARPRTITGRVYLANGEPAKREPIRVLEGDFHTATNDEGAFVLDVADDRPGPWTLRIRTIDGKQAGRVSGVRTGDTNLLIWLEPTSPR